MFSAALQKSIQKIGDKYNLKLILIHGSYAKNKQRIGSDLDIAILGKQSIDWKIFNNIFNDLENIFGNKEERELDLKTLENVDPLFLYQVMKDSILLYGSSFDYWELKTYAIRNYWDSAPIFKLEDALLNKYFKRKYV
ncbi:MAG: nucleotidyltransferase domain-containing protein [Patescibacteria group bacterium]